MEITLNNVENLTNYTHIYLSISTEDENNYFEKLFGLSKENGRRLVVHAIKEKSIDGSYPYAASIEISIYDNNEELCVIPNGILHDDMYDIKHEINHWLDNNQKKWLNLFIFVKKCFRIYDALTKIWLSVGR